MSTDLDDFSSTRPFECEGCGRRMRTRGIDGLCITCMEPLAQRCERCQRVRLSAGGDWENHPGLMPREVLCICATCGEARLKQQERAQKQLDIQLLAERAAGYGPGDDDPFSKLIGG